MSKGVVVTKKWHISTKIACMYANSFKPVTGWSAGWLAAAAKADRS